MKTERGAMIRYSDKIINNTVYGGAVDVHSLDLKRAAFAPLVEAGLGCLGLARIEGPYLMTRKGGNEEDHTHYHFVFEGGELLETLDADFPVDAGRFVTVPQRFRRRYSLKKGESYLFLYMGVDNAASDPTFKFDEVRSGCMAEPWKLLSLFKLMLDEASNPSRPGADLAMKSCAEILLALLRRDVAKLRDSRRVQRDDSLRSLWAQVEERLERPWTFPALAKAAGLSKTQLHDLCARHYGQAPGERLCKLRMEKAKKLLFESSDKLDVVAAKVGYGSAYAFSKAFLKHCGVRPGAFRRGF